MLLILYVLALAALVHSGLLNIPALAVLATVGLSAFWLGPVLLMRRRNDWWLDVLYGRLCAKPEAAEAALSQLRSRARRCLLLAPLPVVWRTLRMAGLVAKPAKLVKLRQERLAATPGLVLLRGEAAAAGPPPTAPADASLSGAKGSVLAAMLYFECRDALASGEASTSVDGLISALERNGHRVEAETLRWEIAVRAEDWVAAREAAGKVDSLLREGRAVPMFLRDPLLELGIVQGKWKNDDPRAEWLAAARHFAEERAKRHGELLLAMTEVLSGDLERAASRLANLMETPSSNPNLRWCEQLLWATASPNEPNPKELLRLETTMPRSWVQLLAGAVDFK